MSEKNVTAIGGVSAGRDVSGNNIIIGDNNTQTLTIEQVRDNISELRRIVDTQVPDGEAKTKALHHIDTAAEDAEKDAAFAAKSLEKANDVLKGSEEVVNNTLSLWDSLNPVFARLGPWLLAAGITIGV